jgi:hypothetical protein
VVVGILSSREDTFENDHILERTERTWPYRIAFCWEETGGQDIMVLVVVFEKTEGMYKLSNRFWKKKPYRVECRKEGDPQAAETLLILLLGSMERQSHIVACYRFWNRALITDAS